MRKIGVVGLGYVGLPLAVEFGKHFETVGFDLKAERIEALRHGRDATREVGPEQLGEARKLALTTDPAALASCTFFIVTVPTPVDRHNAPDLRPLLSASATVGKALKRGDIVVYESTVFPGCTEECCVPVLERESGLVFNRDFACGYSPERINPGDRQHTLTKIAKVTSGSTPAAADEVDEIYRTIITAGTYRAPSLRVAEAAKVIENSQRDINIAFVNELALIFHKLGIDTHDVLAAARTKWNFLPFAPGLVGGHCIGVDPFYLTHRAQEAGYNPEVILAGRRLNDNMGAHVASRVIKAMIRKGTTVGGSRVLVLGVTFKENCPDVRNSKVATIITELREFGCEVEVHDPWADAAEVRHEYGFSLTGPSGTYDAIVAAVAHEAFRSLDLSPFRGSRTVVFDVKGFLDRSIVDDRL